ncbi:N4-gp56 family major capsid protein [Streptococcus iners]|uniref:N4-gp56 family major capsid protein n=1 Tax=Streptococcus iners TaxID=3028084 RepID=A0AA97AEM7_9STRE|nr:N4-gp56 family major capsid protein [Streptococcus sp. 29887]MCK4024890.1 N4-gp56 family major capsid protein [Streptococcus suis]WNY51531.1 N4-gp56 family major capsid protein [Streptococcus sp. 29887]
MTQTKIADLINPQVMANHISAKLPKSLKFTPLATIERTLVGQPGTKLTVPKFTYTGAASEVAEGQAIPLNKLGTTTTEMTIKKIATGYEITDEAILSGMGDPVGEAVRQLRLAIADKMDSDIIELAKTATQHVTDAPNTLEAIQKALDIFADEEDVRYVGIFNPVDAMKLRTAAGKDFLRGSELGAQALVSGVFGEVLGVEIVRSKKVTAGQGFIVAISARSTDAEDDARYGAFVINMKRDVSVETDRDILKKTTVITGDEHYGVYLYDDTKVVRFGGN